MLYEGGVKKITIRLTPYQSHKLMSIKKTFGFSYQRIVTDLLDVFAVDTLRVLNGTESLLDATKDTASKLLNNYAEVDKIRGIVKAPYTRH